MQPHLTVDEVVTLRPLFARVATTAYLSTALALTPPFGALYAISWSSGGAVTVAVINAVVLAIVFAAIGLLRAASVTMSNDEIVERGYLGRLHHTPVAELSSILIVRVYSGRSLDSSKNVFFLDGDGRTRLRMRGQFWGEDAIRRAVDAYDLPVERIAEPMPRSELRHRYKSKLYAYERHPSVTYLCGALVVLAVSAPLIAALNSVI